MPRKFDKTEWQMLRHGAEAGEERIVYAEATSDRVWWASEGNRVFVACVFGDQYMEDIASIVMVKPERNEVSFAYTRPEYQRLGLASKLLEIARRETGATLDSDDGKRSESGAAWGTAQGLEQRGSEAGANWNQQEADFKGSSHLMEALTAAIYGAVDFREIEGGPSVPKADWR